MGAERIVCRHDALTPEQRERKSFLMSRLAAAVDDVADVTGGFSFRYRTDVQTWATVAEFIDLERRCCPFFRFQAEIEAGDGPVRLTLTGDEGVKEFLARTIGAPGVP